MQIRPTMVRALPADLDRRPFPTRAAADRRRTRAGSTRASMAPGVVQVCPYETPAPAGTRFTIASRARSVIAGRSPSSADGSARPNGDSPYVAMPGRTRSKWVSGRASVPPELARWRICGSTPSDSRDVDGRQEGRRSAASLTGLFGSSDEARCDQIPMISIRPATCSSATRPGPGPATPPVCAAAAHAGVDLEVHPGRAGPSTPAASSSISQGADADRSMPAAMACSSGSPGVVSQQKIGPVSPAARSASASSMHGDADPVRHRPPRGRAGDRHHPVAVAVGLHHCHQLRRCPRAHAA